MNKVKQYIAKINSVAATYNDLSILLNVMRQEQKKHGVITDDQLDVLTYIMSGYTLGFDVNYIIGHMGSASKTFLDQVDLSKDTVVNNKKYVILVFVKHPGSDDVIYRIFLNNQTIHNTNRNTREGSSEKHLTARFMGPYHGPVHELFDDVEKEDPNSPYQEEDYILTLFGNRFNMVYQDEFKELLGKELNCSTVAWLTGEWDEEEDSQ